MHNNVINYGQHFLVDESVIDRFISFAEITNKDVIEIGPGNGVLTKKICLKAHQVTCYEIDKSLSKNLDDIIHLNSNIKIIYDNFLDVDINKCDVIISGLPYQILEPFLKKLIKIEFDQTLIIIGKNYAHSLFRECFLNNEIKFTNLLTKCFFFVNVYDDILPSSFSPAPNTISSMVEFKMRDKITLVESQELYFFRELIEQADKKIKNALVEGLIHFYKYRGKNITKNKAKEIINRLEIPNDILDNKVDNLSNKQIVKLYLIFKNKSVHL